MAQVPAINLPKVGLKFRDIAFAVGILTILSILFLPIPAFMIDIGLAFSIAFSVLILMVALWIQRPLDFSSFPTVLLIATMVRLSLNIATTRVILSHGNEGHNAAGGVIAGFASLVMSGDFVIGLIVFMILIVVNFIVITKGATRIAEVGARFTLDAIPGKQMSIDADLSAGLIDEKQAQVRRRELEEESSFFGSMDGASKFVRGDAIAGLIITAINVFGGIVIGYFRHGMELSEAADVFVKLSVGDGLVSQIPALIVSLAAGLIVSRGGTAGSTDQAVVNQLSGYPRALLVAAGLMFLLAIMPGLPLIPFAMLGGVMAFGSWVIPRRIAEESRVKREQEAREVQASRDQEKDSVKSVLKTAEIELLLGKQVSTRLLGAHLHPQPAPHPRSGRRARPACAQDRADRRACAHPHVAADLRRPCRERRAAGSAPRQQVGHGLPPGAQARLQGRDRRVRHRPAPARGVLRAGDPGYPRVSRPRHAVCAGHLARIPLLCAHDHRAPLRHIAGSLACRACQGHRDQDSRLHLMITDPEGTVLALFAAFCRVGGCFMLMPGFSSARIPMQIRLFVSVAVSMAILPIMWDTIYPRASGSLDGYLSMIAFETLTGAVIGLIARYYVLGLQFAGTVLTMMMGFNAPPTPDVLEETAENQLTNLLSFCALMVLFLLDFHHVVMRALVDSYSVMPLGAGFNPQSALITLTDTLSQTFMIMLRLASPFILYGLVFNVTIGLINKLAPQIPIYFISLPFLIIGGMILLYFGVSSLLEIFTAGFLPVFRGE